MTRNRNTLSLLLGATLGVALAAASASAQEKFRGLEPLTQMASATPFGVDRGLGRPVVLSRSDLESPLNRVRSFDSEPTLAPAAAPPIADPAFKSVLLTPHDSTGRPIQPLYEPPPDEPAEQSLPPAGGTLKVLGTQPSKGPGVGTAKGNSPVRNSPPQPPKAQVARAAPAQSPPKFGPAEIGAVRAFSRF
jgi:hypothetical protein